MPDNCSKPTYPVVELSELLCLWVEAEHRRPEPGDELVGTILACATVPLAPTANFRSGPETATSWLFCRGSYPSGKQRRQIPWSFGMVAGSEDILGNSLQLVRNRGVTGLWASVSIRPGPERYLVRFGFRHRFPYRRPQA
jgi:hypothetical protein